MSRLRYLRGVEYVIGIGAGATRRALDEVAASHGLEACTLVHPMCSVGPDVRLAAGVVVFAFATVTTNVSLGRHTHVGRGAAVGHDSILGDFVSVYPLAAVSGNVSLESGVTIGTTASVNQGLCVHRDAYVGAGAAVVRDVPARAVSVRVPARIRMASIEL